LGIPDAPHWEIRAVHTGSLDEVDSREGLGPPQPEGLPVEPGLDDAEALSPDAPLHLAEMGLAGGSVTVAADTPEVRGPPEALHQILDVGDLLQLPEHKRPQIPLGLIYHGPSRTVSVETVLYLPGSALIEALYPGKEDLEPLERLALSIGLSLALVPLVGLVLNYSPWGIRLNPVYACISLLTISFSLLAVVRKFRVFARSKFD